MSRLTLRTERDRLYLLLIITTSWSHYLYHPIGARPSLASVQCVTTFIWLVSDRLWCVTFCAWLTLLSAQCKDYLPLPLSSEQCVTPVTSVWKLCMTTFSWSVRDYLYYLMCVTYVRDYLLISVWPPLRDRSYLLICEWVHATDDLWCHLLCLCGSLTKRAVEHGHDECQGRSVDKVHKGGLQ